MFPLVAKAHSRAPCGLTKTSLQTVCPLAVFLQAAATALSCLWAVLVVFVAWLPAPGQEVYVPPACPMACGSGQ